MKKLFLIPFLVLLVSFAKAPKEEQIELEEQFVFPEISSLGKVDKHFESSLKTFRLPEPKFDQKIHLEQKENWKQKDGVVTYDPDLSITFPMIKLGNSPISWEQEIVKEDGQLNTRFHFSINWGR